MTKRLLTRLRHLTVLLISAQMIVTQAHARDVNEDLIAWTMVPVIRSVQTTLDGEKIAILRAASKEGPYVLEIYETDKLDQEPVRFDGGDNEIRSFSWVSNDRLWINLFRDIRNANSYEPEFRQAIIQANAKGDWLFVDPDRSASLVSSLPEDPKHIIISTDNNDNRIPDIVRMNIRTGSKTTIHRGTEKVPGGFGLDVDREIRIASAYDFSVNGFNYWARKKGKKDWIKVKTVRPDDDGNYNILGFSDDNPNQMIISANGGENTTGLYMFDLDTMQMSERIFGTARYDVNGLLRSGKIADKNKIIGYSYIGKGFERVFTDPDAQAFHDGIQALFPGQEVFYNSRSQDDKTIVVYVEGARTPPSYYLIRNLSDVTFIGSSKPLLTEDKLSDVKFISYTTRDGYKIPAYVTIPKGKAPFPAVVMPHGGPWARDSQAYDEWAQLMAHHGYLVIQPQFRGSTGFGQDLWQSAHKEWGQLMQDDIDDAADFLIKRGLADPDRVAIHGYSYGGYAAFVASFREGSAFKCSIAGAGVSDLDNIGSGLSTNRFLREFQKPTIKGVNPTDHVKEVRMPILVMHGDRDVRVPVKHSRTFVSKLKRHNKDHKYVEIKGMRHSLPFTQEQTEIYYTNLIDWLDNHCFK